MTATTGEVAKWSRFVQGQEGVLKERLKELSGRPRDVVAATARMLGEAPRDLPDHSTIAHEQDVVVVLVNGQGAEREAVLIALERIREKTYGTCEDCSDQIGIVRLRAIAAARLCKACQEHLEAEAGVGRGQVLPPAKRVPVVVAIPAESGSGRAARKKR